MNKTILIVLALLLVGGGVIWFFNNQSVSPQSDSLLDQGSLVSETGDIPSDDTLNSQGGTYVEYTKEVLEGVTGRRVLYFYANWCPTCRPADADLRANESRLPADVTVIRVNYNDSETDDEEKQLASRYNITYQHTFVQIDDTGEEITQWNGGKTDDVLSNVQ